MTGIGFSPPFLSRIAPFFSSSFMELQLGLQQDSVVEISLAVSAVCRAVQALKVVASQSQVSDLVSVSNHCHSDLTLASVIWSSKLCSIKSSSICFVFIVQQYLRVKFREFWDRHFEYSDIALVCIFYLAML